MYVNLTGKKIACSKEACHKGTKNLFSFRRILVSSEYNCTSKKVAIDILRSETGPGSASMMVGPGNPHSVFVGAPTIVVVEEIALPGAEAAIWIAGRVEIRQSRSFQ